MKIEIFLDDKIINNLKQHINNQNIEKFLEEKLLEEIEDYLLGLHMKGTNKTISYNEGMNILKEKIAN
jgi:hypothetical protein